MGQTITAKPRAGSRPEIVIFELNRSITGMGVERYASGEAATGKRAVDVLARRLFAVGASAVTAYSNMVTVDAPPTSWPVLEEKVRFVIEHLLRYYGEDAGWSPEARELTSEDLALEISRRPS